METRRHALVERAISLSIAGVLALQATAYAQPKPAAPAAAAPAPAAPVADAPPAPTDAVKSEADRKQQAYEHFTKGITLSDAGSWAAALAEFLQSRALFPSRGNTKNAALSLKNLNRFDEALDMFESLLREFGDLAPEDKAFAQRQVTELRGLVGTIDVDGAEPGAAIIVDGRGRADFPLVAPLRVPSGTHTVRVFKEGFEPFEGRVDVAGGQTARVVAKLRALSASGRLRVAEKSGKVLDVVVDNAVVGQTPWEGTLAVGDHVVLLRGKGNLGTQPARAPVKQQAVTPLTLSAEELDGSLIVQVTPAGANVSLDSVNVGRGVWDGKLRAGAHRVEVTTEGFFPSRSDVTLARGERKVLKIDLRRDEESTLWHNPPKIAFDVSAALAITPSFGGDVAGDCTGECSIGLGAGLLATGSAIYELGSGIGFGISGGYLLAQQKIERRATAITPQGLAPVSGTADDVLRLTGGLLGATASYHYGDDFPTVFRMGAGAFIGSMRDVRNATFDATGGAFAAPEIGDSRPARYIYLDPEVRFGARFANHFEVSAGLRALFLIALTQPKWSEETDLPVVLPSEGYAAYDKDALSGKLVVFFAPGINARYDF